MSKKRRNKNRKRQQQQQQQEAAPRNGFHRHNNNKQLSINPTWNADFRSNENEQQQQQQDTVNDAAVHSMVKNRAEATATAPLHFLNNTTTDSKVTPTMIMLTTQSALNNNNNSSAETINNTASNTSTTFSLSRKRALEQVDFVYPKEKSSNNTNEASSSYSSSSFHVPYVFGKHKWILHENGQQQAEQISCHRPSGTGGATSSSQQQQHATPKNSSQSIEDILHPNRKKKHNEQQQHNTEEASSSSSSSPQSNHHQSTISKNAEQQQPQQHQQQQNQHLSGLSVEEAVRDKVGCRPRANSTDGELNLPRRGLCDEGLVMASYRWNTTHNNNNNHYSSSSNNVSSNNSNGNSIDIIRAHPKGFYNLGNTCFLNSVLNCLGYIPPFCQPLMAMSTPSSLQQAQQEQRHNNKTPAGKKVTLLLRSLFHQMHNVASPARLGNNNNNNGISNAISPRGIVQAVPSLSAICGSSNNKGYKFRPGRQEDAHEFLVHLLDAMNDGELRQAGINQHKSGWRDCLPIPRLDETTFIRRIFGGYLRSQVCCTKCGYKSSTYDPFLDLSLEVSRQNCKTLLDALQEFTRKETLDSANRWKCSGCKRLVCATKQLTVFRPSLSLCIQLKRFAYSGNIMGGGSSGGSGGLLSGFGLGRGSRKKITRPILFPAHLNLPLSDNRSCAYSLTGVVIHLGGTATSGHYTAYIKKPGKNGQDCWFHVDDSHVEAVSERMVLQQKDAYLLFYSRQEVKLAFPPPPLPGSSSSSSTFSSEEDAGTSTSTNHSLAARARSSSMDKSVASCTSTTTTTDSPAVSLTRKRGRDGELSFSEKTHNSTDQAKSNKNESPADEKKMEAQPNLSNKERLLPARSSSSSSSSSSDSSSSDDSSSSSSSSSDEQSSSAKMSPSPEKALGPINNKKTLDKSAPLKVQQGPQNKRNDDSSGDDETSPLPDINTASATSSSAEEEEDDDDDMDDKPQGAQKVTTLVPRKKSLEFSSKKENESDAPSSSQSENHKGQPETSRCASNGAGNITSLEAADVKSKDDSSTRLSKEEDGTPGTAKSKKDSTRTRIVLPRGEGREKVEVMLGPRRNSKAWRPKTHIATRAEGFDLLGTVQVDKWDDQEVDDDATKAISRQARPAIVRKMQKAESSKKRKMYLDKWDTMLDQGKQKKVKAKKEEWETPARNNQFQQIQAGIQSMNRGRAKGYHRQEAKGYHRQEAKGYHRQEAKGYHRQEKRNKGQDRGNNKGRR